jgi:peptide/nickel transport system permease protein
VTTYLIRRALRGVLVLFLVSVVVFGMSLLAGDPIKLLIPVETTPEQLEQLRTAYGLNDPAPVRFFRFLGGLVRGDLGYSYRFQQPAFPIVIERLSATLELAISAMLFVLLFAIPAGLISALKKDSPVDAVVIAGSVVGNSIPTFFLGLVLIYLLAVNLHILPTSGRGTAAHILMPAVTLGLFYTGRVARLVRSSMLDVLHQDYMRTARAKGLSEWMTIVRHGLKNAALPVVTILGLDFGALLGGAVVTETVFAWPGIGNLAVQAVIARDYPIVQGVVIIVATSFVFINLAVDLVYTYLDPRIKYA